MADTMDTPEYYRYPRTEMLPFLPEAPSRVLEIGCGAGAFAAEVRKRHPGCRILGVDRDEAALAKAAAVCDEVRHGDAQEAADRLLAEPGRFDVVVLNDILEHLEDPWRILRSIRGLLAPGGRVVASIPNVRFAPVIKDLVVRGEWTYTGAGVLDRTHLRFFTRKSIVAAFSECGFKVDRIEGINPGSRVSWKLRLLGVLTGGWVDDWRYPQFGLTASVEAAGAAR